MKMPGIWIVFLLFLLGHPGAAFSVNGQSNKSPDRDASAVWTRTAAASGSVLSADSEKNRVVAPAQQLAGQDGPCIDEWKGDTMEKQADSVFAALDDQARVLLQKMTRAEKLAQMRQVSLADLAKEGHLDEERMQNQLAQGVGSLECPRLWLRNSAELVAEAQNFLRHNTRLAVPALVVTETLHGLLVPGATIFPQAIALASTWNPDLAEQMAAAAAREAVAVGCNQALAPDLDLARDPRWGRVEETFGEDPFLVARMGRAYILGMQGKEPIISGNHIACTAKHFTAHGSPEGGINLGPVHGGLRELRSMFLPPFETAVKDAHVAAVMNAYSCYDGVPAAANRFFFTEILRDEWHFPGYVISDYGSITMLCSFHRVAASEREAALQALQAGIDLEAPYDQCFRHLSDLVDAGDVPEEAIDRAVLRILRTKLRLDLWNRPLSTVELVQQVCRQPEHVALAGRIADESIILLKNDNHLLPLSPELTSLAVIGPNADQVQFGDYSWSKDNQDGVTVLQGIREILSKEVQIRTARGCDIHSLDSSGIAPAVAVARQSQVAIVVVGGTSAVLSGIGWGKEHGYENATCGEGFDVTSLELPGLQQQLVEAVVATGTPTVVVLMHGRPHSIKWISDHVPAVVEAWYPGQEGGRAIARVLFGQVNPSGRLPVSVPQSVGHVPVYYNHKISRGGYYHRPGTPTQPGRDYVFSDPKPLFPFGHGLSYSDFEYTDLQIDKPHPEITDTLTIRLRIHNRSKIDGREVVQLYVRDCVSSVTIPQLQLKAFNKISIAAGKSEWIEFRLPIADLWLIDRSLQKVVEPGEFEILLGASSVDIRLQEIIAVHSGK